MFRPLFFGALLTMAAIVAACEASDQSYGDPSGIVGKKLPGETGGTTTSTSSGSTTSSGATTTPTASAPTQTVAAAHTAGGGPVQPFTTDCLTCHGGTGPATAKFAFGGLVANAAGATVTVVVDGLTPVGTDDAGYFWSTSTTAIASGSSVNLYDGAKTGKMPSVGGGCMGATGCHGATSPGPIQVQ